jgi:phage terminase large subunit
METKEQLTQGVNAWKKINTEIVHLTKIINEKKQIRKKITDALSDAMNTHELGQLNTADGSIVYKQKKVKKPLGKKMLVDALSSFYEDDEETSTAVLQHVLSHQTVTLKDTITQKLLS